MRALHALLIAASGAGALSVEKPRLVNGGSNSDFITTASLVEFQWLMGDSDPSHINYNMEGTKRNYTVGTNTTTDAGQWGSMTITMNNFSPDTYQLVFYETNTERELAKSSEFEVHSEDDAPDAAQHAHVRGRTLSIITPLLSLALLSLSQGVH
ncbi:hypothetical protein CYLTODRAFT_487408 [Cylindrobasidium torrendii FP15055 ss-10]|uniref:Uncharacterized protein n=1 Tax=Cylindrobasidium torrendii FP15055 ss-10 TaxID=1314674 RepID=A0A0D7BLY1_9AGAR|nr:hypothetical protein CYLTODRAFT_487408 [Cylindrobasidium torrendii FP15055 ss-10]